MTHTIRLRGPWNFTPLARTVLLPDGSTCVESGALPAAGSMRLPSDWGPALGADFHGRVRFERWFGRPTGLGTGDRVLVEFLHVDGRAQVSLGDDVLGEIPWGAGPSQFEVTSKLAPRNRLVVEIEMPRLTPESPPLPRRGREHLPGGLVGEVRLVICDS